MADAAGSSGHKTGRKRENSTSGDDGDEGWKVVKPKKPKIASPIPDECTNDYFVKHASPIFSMLCLSEALKQKCKNIFEVVHPTLVQRALTAGRPKWELNLPLLLDRYGTIAGIDLVFSTHYEVRSWEIEYEDDAEAWDRFYQQAKKTARQKWNNIKRSLGFEGRRGKGMNEVYNSLKLLSTTRAKCAHPEIAVDNDALTDEILKELKGTRFLDKNFDYQVIEAILDLDVDSV